MEDKDVRISNMSKFIIISKAAHIVLISQLFSDICSLHKALYWITVTPSILDAIPDRKSQCEMTSFTLPACTHHCQPQWRQLNQTFDSVFIPQHNFFSLAAFYQCKTMPLLIF